MPSCLSHTQKTCTTHHTSSEEKHLQQDENLVNPIYVK
jgi:hypothetical protein